jgi:hypothetical protein
MLHFFVRLLRIAISYMVITTLVNVLLMGAPRLRFSPACKASRFVIEKPNRIDFQKGNECSAFSSAYVFRHWGNGKNGSDLYKEISGKLRDGCVYPKGISRLFQRHGFSAKYCTGNLNALKNEVSKGNPVIVMIRTYAGKRWLHFVPVVGYDEQFIFIADSLEKLANCGEPFYNRRIPTKEFKKMWNTSMLKMPLYRNTYFVICQRERNTEWVKNFRK